MNKYRVFAMILLCTVSASQGMFKHKDKKNEPDNKTTIHNLAEIKKIQDEQQQFRSKHKAFKDEPTDVAAKMLEKKRDTGGI